MARHFWLAAALLVLTASGCAKNVDKVNFEKWGNSFLPQHASTTGVDTTAQGGSPDADSPTSSNYVIPKASVGGTYQRGKISTSPSYRLVGGFHVRP